MMDEVREQDRGDAAIEQEAAASIRCLAAAERAVEEGRFNLAKILRAAAHAARVRALNLERQRRRHQPAGATLRFELARLRAGPAAAILGIVERAASSLDAHRDVIEGHVPELLWGCHGCGHVAEAARPDRCPACGALGAEFERFGPFYIGTDERLGRRRPDEIIAILRPAPDRVADAFTKLDEVALARRPSTGEWSMKEIAGHMLDVTEIFCRRANALLAATTIVPLDTPVPPWKILEDRGYPEMAGAEIVDRFRAATTEALDLIHRLDPADWARSGTQGGRVVTLLDLAIWLVNHDVAHLEQIRALGEDRWAPA